MEGLDSLKCLSKARISTEGHYRNSYRETIAMHAMPPDEFSEWTYCISGSPPALLTQHLSQYSSPYKAGRTVKTR